MNKTLPDSGLWIVWPERDTFIAFPKYRESRAAYAVENIHACISLNCYSVD